MVYQLPLVAAVAVGVAVPEPAWAAKVSARADDNEARLTFTFAKQVGYQATIQGEKLVITFTEPVKDNLTRAVDAIAEYAFEARKEQGGKRVVLSLNGAMSLRDARDGMGVVITILKDPTAGSTSVADGVPGAGKTAVAAAPPAPSGSETATADPLLATDAAAPAASAEGTMTAPPKAAAQRAATPTRAAAAPPKGGLLVPARVGEHPGFSRVVMDFPRIVDYRVSRQGPATIVSIQAPARIDDRAIKGRKPRHVARFEQQRSDGTTTLQITASDGAVRVYRVGNRVVADIGPGAGGGHTRTAAVEPAPAEAPTGARAGDPPPQPTPLAETNQRSFTAGEAAAGVSDAAKSVQQEAQNYGRAISQTFDKAHRAQNSTGAYAGARIGVAFADLTDGKSSAGTPTKSTARDTLPTAQLSGGFDFGRYGVPVRLEGEYGWRDGLDFNANPLIGGSTASGAFKGSIKTHTAMANVAIDADGPLRIDEAFAPYVLLGLGAAWNVVDGSLVDTAGTEIKASGDDQMQFAWSIGGGVSYWIAPNFVLDSRYRYLSLGEAHVGVTDTSALITAPQRVDADLTVHEVGIGLRYNF